MENSTEVKVESVSAINNNGVTVTFPALTGDITGANVVVKDPAGNTVATVAQNLSKGATSATFPFTAAQTSLAAGTWTVDGKEILVKSQDAGLQNLVSNVGIWNEDFAENKLEGAGNYTVNVKSDVSSIQLTPTVAEGATIIASTIIQSSPTATPVTNRYSFTNNEATTINLSHAGATTSVFITVVAPDGKTSKTYTINVARAVANADNSAVLGGVTLTPNPTGTINGYTFQPTVENYELNVANAVEAVTVAPTGVTGTVYVNGEATSSKLVALASGKNTITVKVVAADNVTTKTYTYTINRAVASANTDTTLNSITLSTGTLNSFEADTANATANASVVHTTTDLTLTPVATNAKATVSVSAVKMDSVPTSGTTRAVAYTTAYATETNRLAVEKNGAAYTVKGLQVTEASEKNVVEIAVTAEDGSVYYHYFEVKRAAAAASSISTLASVGFKADTASNIAGLGSTLPTAEFNATTPFKASTLAYTKNVENTHAAFAINPTATNGSADVVVKVNGIKLTKNTDGYFTGSLIVGQNTITVDVTAANGIDKSTYTYTVNRAQAGASAVKTLATLTSNVGTLTGFVADTTPTAPVTLGVTNTTSEVTITPTASNANATITVEAVKAAANTTLATTANAKTAYDGVTAASNKLTVEKNGSAFTIKGLQIENTTANTTNIAKVTVAPADGSTPEEYYVVIKRAQANASDNAGLAATTGIQYNLGAGATSITGFAPTKTSYDLVASYLQDSIIITPAEGTAGQVITVNGKVVATGTPSDALPLAIGKNEIKVAVVAPNGTTTNTYTLNVTRIANPDASSTKTLSSITTDGVLSGFTANTLPTASANNAIVAKVANNTESITITPKVADSKATVKVTAASGLDSDKTSTNGVTTFKAGKGTALTVTENAGAFTITGLKAAGSGATAQKNLVQVTVTAEDGSTQAYTIDVQRVAAGLSASSKLTDLTFVDAAGLPVDFSNTNEYTFNANTNEYSIVAPNGVENIKFTATAATGSHIKAVADNASEPIFDGLVSGTTADVTASLAAGGTTKVTFTVTSADLTSTSTYTVNVNRAPFNAATTATLSNLTFPGYTYTYVSGTDAVITVADEASLLKFVPTVTGTNARVVVKSADDAKYAVSKAADGTYTVSLKTGTSAFPANGEAAAVAEVYVVTEAGVATKANTIKAQITTP